MPDLYQKAHRRVVKSRGKAASYLCISCDRSAREWALQHRGGHRVDESGRWFSDDPEDYEPMCRGCHQRYDIATQPHVYKVAQERGKNLAQALRGKPPADLFAWRSAAGKKGAQAAGPNLTEHRKRLAAENNTRRRTCVCGFESTVAGLGRHQQVSGHRGRA